MSKQAFDAVYQGGAFHPLAPLDVPLQEGRNVRLLIEETEPMPESLALAFRVYDGLTDDQIDEIEAIALDANGLT
jgi:predicted DNA-binding antitoxin AbrB/MazE fold protein